MYNVLNGVGVGVAQRVDHVISGQRQQVDVFGYDYPTRDGTGERDYVHVMDVADAHVKAVGKMLAHEMPTYDVINVGTGQGRTVVEVIQYIQSSLPKDQVIPYVMCERRPGDVATLVVNVER